MPRVAEGCLWSNSDTGHAIAEPCTRASVQPAPRQRWSRSNMVWWGMVLLDLNPTNPGLKGPTAMCGNRFAAQVHTWIQATVETKGDVISPSLILLTSVTILAHVPSGFWGFLWSHAAALREGALEQKMRAKAFSWGYPSLRNHTVCWAAAWLLQLHRQQPCLSPSACARSGVSAAKWSVVSPALPGSGSREHALSPACHPRGRCPFPGITPAPSSSPPFTLGLLFLQAQGVIPRLTVPCWPGVRLSVWASQAVWLVSSALQPGLYSDECPC